MACPGGCIGGGGQPRSADKEILKKRQAAMYALDERSTIRRSHENPAIAGAPASGGWRKSAEALKQGPPFGTELTKSGRARICRHRRLPKSPAQPLDSHPNAHPPITAFPSALYKNFLEKPNSHLAHDLLHTHYVAGGVEGDK